MANSIRQQIVNAIQARLETILITNGYETNAGTVVYQHKANPISNSVTQAISFADTEEAAVEGENTMGLTSSHVKKLLIEVSLFTNEITQKPAIARKMLADIELCIFKDLAGVDDFVTAQRWGGLAQKSDFVSNNIAVSQQDLIPSLVTYIFTIDYITNLNDPYNQS